jgi:hypothetical protein
MCGIESVAAESSIESDYESKVLLNRRGSWGMKAARSFPKDEPAIFVPRVTRLPMMSGPPLAKGLRARIGARPVADDGPTYLGGRLVAAVPPPAANDPSANKSGARLKIEPVNGPFDLR